MADNKLNPGKIAGIKENARRQLGMLTTIFLLGMAVNLIGLPDEVSGGAKTASNIFLILHMLVAIGLIVGAIRIVISAQKQEKTILTLAKVGSAAIGVAVIAGILTLATKSNWWSYLMAVGFIAGIGVYGRLYSLAEKLSVARG